MEILIGIICGVMLSLLFSLGPAFFSLIQNSIHHGFKKAVSFAVGVSLSDILIVMLMLTVLSNLEFSELTALLHNVYISIIGSITTAVFAVLTWRSKVKQATAPGSHLKFSAEHVTHRWQLLLSGFLLNVLNPLIWIYWLSIITFISAEMSLSVTERYLFFIGMLLAVLGTDILKCRLASMLQHWFTARIMNNFNRVTGCVLMAFSIYLLVSMVFYQTNDHNGSIENVVKSVHGVMGPDETSQNDTITYGRN
ncbi:MAG: LysE family transporter [Bacteroidales bacterium]|nr:LysE family transporter [Bacteroidales bacterium]